MDTFEHQIIVDSAIEFCFGNRLKSTIKTKTGSYEFTLGELSSLAGDFAKEPRDIANEAAKYRELMGVVGTEKRDLLDIVANSNRLFPGRFLSLAMSNYSHFRNGKGSENAMESMRKYHMSALSHSHREGGLNTAYHWGFAAHYIVDLCAGGHMTVPRGAVSTHLLNRSPAFAKREENAKIVGAFIAGIAHDKYNETGTPATFYKISDLRQTDGRLRSPSDSFFSDMKKRSIGTFRGDDNIDIASIKQLATNQSGYDSLVKLYDSKPALAQMISLLVADYSQMYHSRREELAARGFLRVCPWMIKSRDKKDTFKYDDFVRLCVPSPIEVKPIIQTDSEGKVFWRGETGPQNVFGGNFRIQIINNSSDGSINDIDITVLTPYWFLPDKQFLGSSDTAKGLFGAIRPSTNPMTDAGIQLYLPILNSFL